jgi:hypothetical protein
MSGVFKMKGSGAFSSATKVEDTEVPGMEEVCFLECLGLKGSCEIDSVIAQSCSQE